MVKKLYFSFQKWHIGIVVIGVVFVAIFISTHIPKKQELGFSRQLLNPGEYRGNIPGVFDTVISHTEKEVEVSIKRAETSLSFQLPIEQTTVTEKKNLISFSSPNGTISTTYELLADGIKENIILYKIPQENTFPSRLKTQGLITKISSEGIPVFFDKTNTYQFHFQRPFVKDAAGNVSYDVKYIIGEQPQNAEQDKNKFRFTTQLLSDLQTINQTSNTYTLIVEVNSAWLHDPKRVLPVTIDPTVVHNTSGTFATGSLDRVTDTGSGVSPKLEGYYQELPTDQYTAGLWHLDEASGNVLDSSGNNNTGVPTGTTVDTTTHRLGSAARTLNGTSDFITIADNNTLSFPNNTMTAEAWVKRNGNPAVSETIILKGVTAWEYTMVIDTNGLILSTLWTSGGGNVASVLSNAKVTNGNWHHVAFTSNGSVLSVYIDGQLSNSSTAFSGTMTNTAATLKFGNRSDTANTFFEGTLDEVRLSNSARTPEEIKSAASRRPSSTYTSPVVDLVTNVISWNNFTWSEGGVTTGYGETPFSTTGLVAQWNLNDRGDGIATADLGTCGTTCNGALIGFSNTSNSDVVPGSGWTIMNQRWGAGALMFDGVDDRISIADTGFLDIVGNITLEAWIKPSVLAPATAGGGGFILAKASAYYLEQSNSGRIRVYFSGLSAPGYHEGNIVLKIGDWNHIVTTYNGSAVSIYVNGVLDKTVSATGAITNSASTLDIGKYSGGGYEYRGLIDSSRIYSRALTADEILSNYNSSNVDFQTRVGNTTDPNDGTWEAWKPTTSETAIDSMDTSAGKWTVDRNQNSASTISKIGAINTGTGVDGACVISNGIKTLNSTAGSSVCNGSARTTAYAVNFSLSSPLSGGDVSYASGYVIHTFKSNGVLEVPAGAGRNVEVLVVAGGGGGGMDMGGGGGGGGVIYNASYAVTAGQSIAVTVGGGGAGAPAAGTNGQPTSHQYKISAVNGQNSVFGTLVAIGGGFGGSSYYAYTPGAAGANGGSGGGASAYSDGGIRAGGTGLAGQGYRGGQGGGQYYSGGGGGAGGAGADSTNQPNGGVGFYSTISGAGYYWGGGGGGASHSLSTGGNGGFGGGGGGGVWSGSGGFGGGGGLNVGLNGGNGAASYVYTSIGGHAGANTGGGGGGGAHYYNKGGNGGSGIVIVRYLHTPSIARAGDTSITLPFPPTGLAVGDEFLIINLQGTSANYDSVGTYETHIISSINSNTLNFTDSPLKYTYDGTTQKIMVQRVPNFTNVTINSTINGSSSALAGKSCYSLKLDGINTDGVYWIDPDAQGANPPFQVYCDMTSQGGGWTLALNLQTSDGATRHYYDTDFWTGTAQYGAVSTPFAADYKSTSFSQYPATEIMMMANNNGAQMGTATYSLNAPASEKTLHWMFNNLSNTTITSVRKANSGSVWTNTRARNAGDAFIDNSHAMIINSTYQPLDANNETRLGTNYGSVCNKINCNGHNYGGWGGRHYRGGWGTYYEGAALNGYCSSQGGFGSNGFAYNGSDAFNGCSPAYHNIDMAVFVRNTTDTADTMLTASAWDGTKNGVLFFRANGTVTNNALIDVSKKGYRGGDVGSSYESYSTNPAPYTGESYTGPAIPSYTKANGGGGSGGIANNKEGMTGGYGGGYGTYGGTGISAYQNPLTDGQAGRTYGSNNLDLVFLGSGGGEGSNPYGNSGNGWYNQSTGQLPPYGVGGDGGGIIIISANSLVNNSLIRADGDMGGDGYLYSNTSSFISGGGGGGGSGGSILISANTISNTLFNAVGGVGGQAASTPYGGWSTAPIGGGGGAGRIAVYYSNSYSGSTAPVAYTQKLQSHIKTEGTGALQLSTGRPEVDSSTVALWHFDETGGTGSYIKDSAGTPPSSAIGGTITYSGPYTIHTFTSSGTFTPSSAGTVEVLVVAGGGGGGMDMGGGGGGGGVIEKRSYSVSANTPITVTVGGGGAGAPAANTFGQPGGHQYTIRATNGQNSVFGTLTAIGGGFGGSSYQGYTPGISGGGGGSGGGASGYNDNAGTFYGGTGTLGQGNRGGNSSTAYYSGGGGGAGGAGTDSTSQANGGIGFLSAINGTNYYWGGGGGGAGYSIGGGNGGVGGGGGGSAGATSGGAGFNNGSAGGGGCTGCWTNTPGGNGGTNTGGGGGGGGHYNSNNKGGNGGSGIVIVRYGRNDGTPTGTTVANGISGKARSFVTNDSITHPTTNISPTAATLEMWVKPSWNWNDGIAHGLWQNNNNTNVNQANWVSLFKWSSNNLYFRVAKPDGTLQDCAPMATNYFNTGQWTHVAAAYSSAGMFLYINGSLVCSTGAITVPNVALDTNGRIGFGHQNSFGNGIIDEVRISNIARTPEEIAENYRMGRDYYMNKTISIADLSSKATVPFYVAADRPGSYLTTTIGESAYANYQPDINTVGLWHLDENNTDISRTCYTLRLGGVTTSGVYTIDPDGPGGEPPIQAYCNMTYDGGGWTMAVKSWYGSGLIGKSNAVGAVADATTRKGNAYKLSDTAIRNIIGPSNNFDVMADQNGYNSAYSTGNYEFVVIRNYTGAWTYEKAIPASTTTTIFQSYRASDQALAWTGNLSCGYDASTGVGGINCYDVISNNPQGGAGCAINMGIASNPGWHHFFMNQYNDDTYLYICNGPQHSSGFDMNHRFWVRERSPVKAIVKDSSGAKNSNLITAVGGAITNVNGYTIHTFTSNGTFQVTNGSGNVETLVVGGGGGGGSDMGGGGGAGGVINNTSYAVTPQSYPITVGLGGVGGPAGQGRVRGTNGQNSIFGTLTAIGGGGGASNHDQSINPAGSGGSGGGASGGAQPPSGGSGGGGGYGGGAAGSGTGGQGYNGSFGIWAWYPGGGGGAGGAGATNLAHGGIGFRSSITGTSLYWGGGGGGSGYSGCGGNGGNGGGGGGAVCGTTGGAGLNTGSPGGGGSINSQTNVPGGKAGANTGGGGGGGSHYNVNNKGGDGGSGIVIIRYPNSSYMSHDNVAIGTFPAQGKIGKGRNFNGSTDYISIPRVTELEPTSAITVDTWFKVNSYSSYTVFFDKAYTSHVNPWYSVHLRADSNTTLSLSVNVSGTVQTVASAAGLNLATNQWYHIAGTYDGTAGKLYLNGQQIGNSYSFPGTITYSNTDWYLGRFRNLSGAGYGINGILDEPRISNTARTADEIRQTYEVGLRSHPITIDFGAKLDAGNLISNSSDLSFTVDATYYGLRQKGSAVFPGDKIIVRENYNGIEYIAQGIVTSINTSTGAATTLSWDAGSTFPAGGFTVNASVFKWQREYWNISGSMYNHRNTITTLSLRLTDGNEGRTIWLDDFKSGESYLTIPTGSTITSAAGNRYFQYRTIFHSSNEAVSANVTSVTVDHFTNSVPAAPTLNSPPQGSTNVELIPTLQTTSTDTDSDYLRYKIELCTDLAMTQNCQTFDQTSSQTGWSGQNAQTNTAYASGMQASYTLTSSLTVNTTYYWRSYAIDPGGTNTWSGTQTPFSFTTVAILGGPATGCKVTRTNNTNVIEWVDHATNETGYAVQRNVNNGGWLDLNMALDPNTQTLVDSAIQTNTSYQYRMAPFITGPVYGAWCTTTVQNINIGNFQFGGGFNFSGFTIN